MSTHPDANSSVGAVPAGFLGDASGPAASEESAPIGACRIRRVRCVRIDNDPTCEGCRKRDLNCTRLRFGIGKYKLREGRRIAAAVATFGRANPEDAGGPQPGATGSGSPEGFVADALVRFAGPPTETSTEAWLARSEDHASLIASLIDTYVSSSSFCLPVFRYQALQRQFDRAGRRLQQLPLFSEILALGAVCFGALISDHPLIVGNDAPSIYQARRLGFSTSLGQYARRRLRTTARLVEDFIAMVDRRGVFRVPCVESMAVLDMAADCIAHFQGKRSFDLSRPYWAALTAHARQIAEEGRPLDNELDNKPEFHLLMNDSFRSAHFGQRLIVNDEDLEQLFGKLRTPDAALPALDDLPNALASTDAAVFGRLAGAWAFALVMLNRSMATKISIPFEKDQPIPLARFESAIDRASSLLHLTLDARDVSRRAAASTTAVEIRGRQRAVNGTALVDALEAIPLGVGCHFMVLHRKFRQWRQRLETFREIGLADHPTLPVVEDQRSIKAVGDRLDCCMVEVLELLASTIEERRDDATDLFCHHSIMVFPRWFFKWFSMTALSIKCAENGGPATFPLKKQLEIVQTLIEGLRVQAWAWISMQDDAEAVDSALRKYRAAVIARRSSRSVGATALTDPKAKRKQPAAAAEHMESARPASPPRRHSQPAEPPSTHQATPRAPPHPPAHLSLPHVVVSHPAALPRADHHAQRPYPAYGYSTAAHQPVRGHAVDLSAATPLAAPSVAGAYQASSYPYHPYPQPQPHSAPPNTTSWRPDHRSAPGYHQNQNPPGDWQQVLNDFLSHSTTAGN